MCHRCHQPPTPSFPPSLPSTYLLPLPPPPTRPVPPARRNDAPHIGDDDEIADQKPRALTLSNVKQSQCCTGRKEALFFCPGAAVHVRLRRRRLAGQSTDRYGRRAKSLRSSRYNSMMTSSARQTSHGDARRRQAIDTRDTTCGTAQSVGGRKSQQPPSSSCSATTSRASDRNGRSDF